MGDDGRGYLDFDLEIGLGEGGRLVAQVVDSPAGQAEHEFVMPLDPLELENFVLRVGRTRSGRRRVGSPQYRLAQDVGTRLYDALFAGEVRIAFRRSLDRADAQGKGLRLRLRVDEAPALGQVPWEYLYSPGIGDFIVLSSLTPLVRHLDLPHRDERLGIDPPLRVLVVVASPTDLEQLDTHREVELVRRAVGDLSARGSVVVDQVEHVTLQDLRRTLRRGEYHVLHFVGHGGYDEQHEDGVLAFEDDDGRSRHIAGSQLGTVLHDHRSLRLVVLNACEGARTSADDPFSGVAQSLLRRGVPAVVAMQFEITDEAAIAFSHELYLALVEGEPVESAVAEARMEIFASDNDIEWGTPVLYSRAGDGRLFDVAEHIGEDAPPLLPPTELPPPPPPSPAPVADDAPTVDVDLTSEVAAAVGTPDTGHRASSEPRARVARHESSDGPADDVVDEHATIDVRRDVDDPPTTAVRRDDVPTAPTPQVTHETWPAPPRPPAPTDDHGGSDRGGGNDDGGEDDTEDEVARRPRRGRWVLIGAAVTFAALVVLGAVMEAIDPTVEPGPGGTAVPTTPTTPQSSAEEAELTPPAEGQTPIDTDGSWFDRADLVAAPLTVVPALDGLPLEYPFDAAPYRADVVIAGQADALVAADFAIAWDLDALWLFGFVEDVDPSSPFADDPSQLFRGDSFHFEIGSDPTGAGSDAPLRPGDLHVMAGPDVDGQGTLVGVVHAVNTVDGGVFVGDADATDLVGVAAMPYALGYQVEVAVPWSSLGIDPVAGLVLGINVNASDVSGDELFAMVSSNPGRDGASQNHPGRWQTVVLADESFPG